MKKINQKNEKMNVNEQYQKEKMKEIKNERNEKDKK